MSSQVRQWGSIGPAEAEERPLRCGILSPDLGAEALGAMGEGGATSPIGRADRHATRKNVDGSIRDGSLEFDLE